MVKQIKEIQDPNVLIKCMVEVIKEKNGIRMIRENTETKWYKKPKYDYGIQYQNENGKWNDIEWKSTYTRAKNEYESQI